MTYDFLMFFLELQLFMHFFTQEDVCWLTETVHLFHLSFIDVNRFAFDSTPWFYYLVVLWATLSQIENLIVVYNPADNSRVPCKLNSRVLYMTVVVVQREWEGAKHTALGRSSVQ